MRESQRSHQRLGLRGREGESDLAIGARHAEVAMATEREYDASVSALLSGIVGDAQHLVRQEIALARQEIREEIAAAKEAGTALAIASAVLGVGGLFLLVTLALGLADLFNWPAWAGFDCDRPQG